MSADEVLEILEEGTIYPEAAPRKRANSVDAPHPLEPPVKKMKITDFVLPSKSAQAVPSTALPELTGKERPAHLNTPIPSSISDPRSPSYVPVSETALKRKAKIGHIEKEAVAKATPKNAPNAALNSPQSVISCLREWKPQLKHYLSATHKSAHSGSSFSYSRAYDLPGGLLWCLACNKSIAFRNLAKVKIHLKGDVHAKGILAFEKNVADLDKFKQFFISEQLAAKESREQATSPGLLTLDSSVHAGRSFALKESLRAGINISQLARIRHLLIDFDCKDEDEMRQYIPSLLKFERLEIKKLLKTARYKSRLDSFIFLIPLPFRKLVYIWDGTPHIGDLCSVVIRIYGSDDLVYNFLIGVKHTDVSPDTSKLARILTEILTTPDDDLVYLTAYFLFHRSTTC